MIFFLGTSLQSLTAAKTTLPGFRYPEVAVSRRNIIFGRENSVRFGRQRRLAIDRCATLSSDKN